MKNGIFRSIPIIIIISLFITVISGLSIEPIDEQTHIVILHINDPHGKLLPYDEKDAKDVGGMTRVATLIRKIRNENPDNTLVLHAGDELSRGDDPTICVGGEVNMLVMDSIGFDAFTPGNGDFYFGLSNLLKQTALMKVPVIHANVFHKENGEQIFPSYIIKEINGIKIGILGLGFVRKEHPSGRVLKLDDPIETAKALLPEIEKKSDIVIALTHIGLGADKLLAEKVPNIDVIVGGHSHNKLDRPMLVPRRDGNSRVVVVQAGEYTRYLGRLDIYVNKEESGNYEISKADGRMITIDDSIEEDEIVSGIIKGYSDRLSEVLCTLDATLRYKNTKEPTIGEFAADAVKIRSGCDVALLDKDSIQKGIEKGKVTLRDVCRIHPWHNHILIFNLTGKQLREALSERNAFVSGKVSDKGEIYKVAVDEFLWSNIKSLKDVPFEETGMTINNILVEHFRELGR